MVRDLVLVLVFNGIGEARLHLLEARVEGWAALVEHLLVEEIVVRLAFGAGIHLLEPTKQVDVGLLLNRGLHKLAAV